eukprot:TRINITY_DN1320_c3_g1_i1.p1 TRINITY_DN1320_c3_g1~~TRINITY_DN1320_c3_g1_i1.p1  ORF type:complete len:118 (-),score=0.24 TRINITY_DN1320_c3_g1_i1:97-450(-)
MFTSLNNVNRFHMQGNIMIMINCDIVLSRLISGSYLDSPSSYYHLISVVSCLIPEISMINFLKSQPDLYTISLLSKTKGETHALEPIPLSCSIVIQVLSIQVAPLLLVPANQLVPSH